VSFQGSIVKEIIEKLLNVEKTAKRIIAEAEEQSNKILQEASMKAREAAQKEKEKALEEGRNLYEKKIAEARERKKKAIESADAKWASLHTIDEKKREEAVRLVMSELAGLS